MAMTKDDMAMVAMEIVAYSGDARTKMLLVKKILRKRKPSLKKAMILF